jgi:C1A family cysteine protease
LNHSVLVTGYNFENDPPYFEFINNWGVKWGEEGFFRMKIGELDNKDDMCEIFKHTSNILVKLN